MPISRIEINQIIKKIEDDSCQSCELPGNTPVIPLRSVKYILCCHEQSDPNTSTGRNPKLVSNVPKELTVERVKGMIQADIDSLTGKSNDINVFLKKFTKLPTITHLETLINYMLILLKEISEAENGT